MSEQNQAHNLPPHSGQDENPPLQMLQMLQMLAWMFMLALVGWLVLATLWHGLAVLIPRPSPTLPKNLHTFFSFLYVYISQLACVGTSILLFYFANRRVLDTKSLIVGTSLSAVVNFVVNYRAEEVVWRQMLGSAAIVWFALFVGLLLGQLLKRSSYLLIAAVAVSLTDIYGVQTGHTQALVETQAQNYLMIRWSILGLGKFFQLFGAGDLVFTALFLAGARRFGWNLTVSALAIFLGFALGFAATVLLRLPMPGLPFISVAFLTANWRRFRLEPEDKKQVVILVVGMILAFAAVSLWKWLH